MLAESKTVGMFGRGLLKADDDPPRVTSAGENGKGTPRPSPVGRARENGHSPTEHAIAAWGGQSLAQIERQELHPYRDQPRKTFDPISLKELAESIKNNGVLTPLLVRPRADKPGYQGELAPEFETACTAYGIDLKQIEKDLAATKDVGRRFVDASKAKAGKGARV